MLTEQLFFIIIAFAIFVFMFLKMMKRNDISYIIVLVLEAIGIALNFLEVLFSIKLNLFLVILKYLFAVFIPLGVIVMEKRGSTLAEVFNLFLIKILLRFNNNKTAKKILLELTSKYPENYEAHRLLAKMYEKEGGMRKAIDEYVQAIDINKRDYDSYYQVAYLLNCLDKKDESSEMLFSLLSKKPDYYEASILLGDMLIEKEQYKEAERIYQDALRYNPISFDLNYNLGIVYTMLNDFNNAKKCYEKAAQLNALSYNSKYSLAEIALIYKNIEEAEQKFLEVIEDEELSADAYYELAKISLIKGEKETAIKYANVAIDIDSKKIAKKVKNEPIFIPIIAKISIPFNLDNRDVNEEEKRIKKMKEKEIKAKEHLEEMINIAQNLSYNDVKMFKRYRGDKPKKKEDEKDKYKEKHE